MPGFKLVIKEEAKSDINEAYRWYESKQKRLGERFIDMLDNYFNRIISAPKSFPKKYKEMRQATLNVFPYIILFEIEKETIIVFAVFNTHKDSKNWPNY